jgi:hypothetical protein
MQGTTHSCKCDIPRCGRGAQSCLRDGTDTSVTWSSFFRSESDYSSDDQSDAEDNVPTKRRFVNEPKDGQLHVPMQPRGMQTILVSFDRSMASRLSPNALVFHLACYHRKRLRCDITISQEAVR